MTSSTRRTTLALELRPVVGSRFQPTGFPDLGAATFERTGTEGDLLLVESAQSMANHLEATTWDSATCQPVAAVDSLPHVRVVDDAGEFLTSSRLEAHRIASAYVLDSKQDGKDFKPVLHDLLGLAKGQALNNRAVAKAVFALDPLSLLHGVFFAQSAWPWQPKIARAVTSFIEAEGVLPAVSGGVKRDSVINTSKDAVEGQSSKEGYGMVPHHRVEYSARTITMYSVVDEQQLRSYGLSDAATELLSALAQWEIATLLDGGLRLRTACDLVPSDDAKTPDVVTVNDRLTKAIDAARGELGTVTELVWAPRGKAAKTKDAD